MSDVPERLTEKAMEIHREMEAAQTWPDTYAVLALALHEIEQAARDLPLTAREKQRNAQLLHAEIAQLWQTRMLRYSRLTVDDEIENALSYYRITFLRELPGLMDDIEEEVLAQYPNLRTLKLPPFVQMGSWIGGDRDGNPFVTAEILRETLRLQSAAALDFYLAELHTLGSELPLSQLLVDISPALAALAARSPDSSAHRADEPYRRALTGLYARLAETSILERYV